MKKHAIVLGLVLAGALLIGDSPMTVDFIVPGALCIVAAAILEVAGHGKKTPDTH